MSYERRCCARPSDLNAYALETDDIVRMLRRELRILEEDAGRFCGDCPLWDTAWELDGLVSWVASVGFAFAVAGGADQWSTGLIGVGQRTLDAVLAGENWHPADHLKHAPAPSAWLRAVNPRCIRHADADYSGSGFIEGRDGQQYPLVAPWVIRDDVRYDADNGIPTSGASVADLDGRDEGWYTIDERIGVERWREAPNALERTMIGVGATVGGRVVGSDEDDVQALVLAPGMAPRFGTTPPTGSTTPAPPAYLNPNVPTAPVDSGQVVIEGIGGTAMADSGSFSAYDIAFQRNVDGRVRALYKRVFVGFDDDGKPFAESVWITGPERNDQVLINYAPAS